MSHYQHLELCSFLFWPAAQHSLGIFLSTSWLDALLLSCSPYTDLSIFTLRGLFFSSVFKVSIRLVAAARESKKEEVGGGTLALVKYEIHSPSTDLWIFILRGLLFWSLCKVSIWLAAAAPESAVEEASSTEVEMLVEAVVVSSLFRSWSRRLFFRLISEGDFFWYLTVGAWAGFPEESNQKEKLGPILIENSKLNPSSNFVFESSRHCFPIEDWSFSSLLEAIVRVSKLQLRSDLAELQTPTEGWQEQW